MTKYKLLLGMAAATLFASCSPAIRAPQIAFEPQARVIGAGGRETAGVQLFYIPTDLYVLTGVKQNDKTGLHLYITANGGDSFEPPIELAKPSADVMTMGQMGPVLLEDPVGPSMDLLYEGGDGRLYFMNSYLFASKFPQAGDLLKKHTAASSAFATMALSPKGVLYVAWLDDRKSDHNKPGSSSLYVMRSLDHGKSFLPPVRVDTNACPCCRPEFAFGDDGSVHIGWRKDFPGEYRDIVVSSSADGATFSGPVRVSSDGWSLRGCPDSGPTLKVVSQRLYVVWYTQGAQNVPQLRSAYTDDMRTFSQAVLASGDALDPNHPAFVSGTKQPIFVFQGRRQRGDVWSPLTAFVATVDGGKVSPPQPMPPGNGSISDPIGLMRDAQTLYIAATSQKGDGKSYVILERARIKAQ